MPSRSRLFWAAIATLLYVSFAAVQHGEGKSAWLGLIALPPFFWEVWRRAERWDKTTLDPNPAALGTIVATTWGILLFLAARSGPAGRPAFDAAANLGTGVASVAALVALARIPTAGGLLPVHRAARSLDAAAFTGLLWAIAVAVPATRALFPADAIVLDPVTIDYATTTAALGGSFVLLAAVVRLRYLRRLELGVGDRAAGALALALTSLGVGVPATALEVGAPDRLLPLTVLAAAAACTWTAVTREPTRVSATLRGTIVVLVLGAPVVLFTAIVARQAPRHAGLVVFAGTTAAVLVGLIARAAARPLGPEQSRWLDALERATARSLDPEPEEAIRAVLAALGSMSRTPETRPELWRRDPEEALRVDVAGYLHVTRAEAPPLLYALAQAEPERTLRADVLSAVQVRRAEVRSLLAWMESRRAFSATLVLDDDGPSGFVLLPRGNRASVMTLEEARAVRVLTDRVSSLLAVSSALARSRDRELAAIARADAIDDERQRLEHLLAEGAEHHRRAARRYAEPVRATAYSPAARLAKDAVERAGAAGRPLSLVTPPGTDPVGWAALAHLAGHHRAGEFVVVDAADAAEQALAIWENPRTSPLSAAQGGSLVLVDAPALPQAMQEHIAAALSRRAPALERSSMLPPLLVVTSALRLELLVEAGRYTRGFARWVAGTEVELPGLVDRAEDLRSLALRELAVLGIARRGRPFGLSSAALRQLAEHSFPGGELELKVVLLRASARATAEVVNERDLLASGFVPVPRTADISPLPLPNRRRARPRHTPRGR